MKKTYLVFLLGLILSSCSSAPLPWQVKDQQQYAEMHTGYADEAAMRYALDHGITPDSAVALRNEHKW